MIAGLVLAAGGSRRFGDRSKLLAGFRGRPLLEHAVSAQCAVPELSRVLVVLGHRSEDVLACVDFGRAEVVICSDWELGQAASLRCGVAAMSHACEKLIVTLGDQPLIAPAAIARCASLPGGARAVYNGRPGHPVVLGRRQMRQVLALRGDQGARGLLGDGPKIECSDLCSGRDVDTPEDLKEMVHEARAVV